MRILFLCKANVSRSQMAAAFYNQLTGTHDADSAGVAVDFPGETLDERKRRLGTSNTLDIMSRLGFDLSENKRTQLTKEMLNGHGKIISMHDREFSPEWLTNDPRYELWDIADPYGKDVQETDKTRQLVLEKVKGLIAYDIVSRKVA